MGSASCPIYVAFEGSDRLPLEHLEIHYSMHGMNVVCRPAKLGSTCETDWPEVMDAEANREYCPANAILQTEKGPIDPMSLIRHNVLNMP
jgi:hypothetical protein